MQHTNKIVVLSKSDRPSLGFLPKATLAILSSVTFALLLSACASTPKPPTQALQAAETAISNAEQARVADYASPELVEAREKLTAARLAVEKEDMLAAHRFAEQARVDAELALAKQNAAKAKAVNEEMQKGISTLKQEMNRNTGVK
ncbi:MAG: DUF4398 domain-containing protein [Pseudomonadota bacterium]